MGDGPPTSEVSEGIPPSSVVVGSPLRDRVEGSEIESVSVGMGSDAEVCPVEPLVVSLAVPFPECPALPVGIPLSEVMTESEAVALPDAVAVEPDPEILPVPDKVELPDFVPDTKPDNELEAPLPVDVG